MRAAAWLLFLFFLITSLFVVFTRHSYAQSSTSTSVGDQPSAISHQPSAAYGSNLDPDVPRDTHSAVQSLVIEVMAAGICQLSGIDPIRSDHRCLGVNSKTGKIGFVENGGGAIGGMGQLIAYTFTPPASSGDYLKYLSSNFGFAKKTYAQTVNPCVDNGANPEGGFGFCSIQPLVQVWVAMRNIAYLLFVIIFVVIGLAIMLRVHIDPRTVMTIENQIPKIIVGILLVTFSFAIAGLLIDIMYVSIYLIANVLLQIDPYGKAITNFGEVATSGTPFDVINRLWPGNPSEIIPTGGFGQLSQRGGTTVTALIGNTLGGGIDLTPDNILGILGNPVGFFLGLLLGIFVSLLILLALLYTCIRLWIICLVSYISILLDIVFAPFWFLIGLFPGSSLGVGAWFKDMLANLAVFPTALSMLLLGRIFYNIASDTTLGANLFSPPLAGGSGSSDTQGIFASIVALGFIFMTPHVLQITRGAIKAPNINYGPVLQPAAAAGGTLRAGAQLGTAARYDPMSLDPGTRRKARILGKLGF